MEIDLRALEHNYRRVEAIVGQDVRILPCVKNAAYGLAIAEVSRRLVALGARALTCGTLEDARSIREAGLGETDIIVFGGTLPAGIRSYLDFDLIPTVHNVEIAEAVSARARRPARVYVKVDAGRGRLGFPISTAKEAILQVARMANVVIDGIYTHLPFTNALEARWAQERTTLFDSLIDCLRQCGLAVPVTQARSSSGVLFGIKDRCSAVAPGRLLYARPPLAEESVGVTTFQPVLSAIRSRLIQVSPDASDRTPGTFGRYADRVMGATGVIPVGRRDGYQAARPGEESFVIVRGAKAPVLAVSSEQAVIDLSGVVGPQLGDEVTLLGRASDLEVTLADLARWYGVGTDDVLLMMRGRFPQIVNHG
jgi:alanine racemase